MGFWSLMELERGGWVDGSYPSDCYDYLSTCSANNDDEDDGQNENGEDNGKTQAIKLGNAPVLLARCIQCLQGDRTRRISIQCTIIDSGIAIIVIFKLLQFSWQMLLYVMGRSQPITNKFSGKLLIKLWKIPRLSIEWETRTMRDNPIIREIMHTLEHINANLLTVLITKCN